FGNGAHVLAAVVVDYGNRPRTVCNMGHDLGQLHTRTDRLDACNKSHINAAVVVASALFEAGMQGIRGDHTLVFTLAVVDNSKVLVVLLQLRERSMQARTGALNECDFAFLSDVAGVENTGDVDAMEERTDVFVC